MFWMVLSAQNELRVQISSRIIVSELSEAPVRPVDAPDAIVLQASSLGLSGMHGGFYIELTIYERTFI